MNLRCWFIAECLHLLLYWSDLICFIDMRHWKWRKQQKFSHLLYFNYYYCNSLSQFFSVDLKDGKLSSTYFPNPRLTPPVQEIEISERLCLSQICETYTKNWINSQRATLHWATYSDSYKTHCENWLLILLYPLTTYSPKWRSSLLTFASLTSMGAFDMWFLNWLLQIKVDYKLYIKIEYKLFSSHPPAHWLL